MSLAEEVAARKAQRRTLRSRLSECAVIVANAAADCGDVLLGRKAAIPIYRASEHETLEFDVDDFLSSIRPKAP